MKALKLFIFFSLLALGGSSLIKTIRVNGTVMCGGKTAGNVVVGLYEHNVVLKDGQLDIVKTDRRGIFNFDESKDEIDQPYIRIQHKCNVEKKDCFKEFELLVPERFVDSKETYKMTYISLDILYKGEKEICE